MNVALTLRQRGYFCPTEGYWLDGSQYGPMQSDGHVFLCPDCGGYGTVPDNGGTLTCKICAGSGEIPLDDARVYQSAGPA